MPIIIEWGNEEKTVVIGTMDWPMTWEEIDTAWQQSMTLMRGVSYPVHMVVVGKTTRFPAGNILTNLQHIIKDIPPNLGLAIMVTDNRFQEIINSILFKVTPRLNKTGHVVPTLEAAYKLIAKEAGKAGK
ncbi:MAG: hypothetical protein H7175_21905 [Burkholderiales bacterium]|nr:hypothetical protein [Anaerolineae bacterium]